MYTRSQINQAGKILVSAPTDTEEYKDALQTLNNWRALHHIPLNSFHVTLRRYVENVAEKHGILVQRIKRALTILDKIKNREQKMQLGRMQDIGGLRAIVENICQLRVIEEKCDRSYTKHHLEKKRDYITEPKDSGYRGVHIIYKYIRPGTEYDGLYVEFQLRTRLQHLWATAVETVGFFFQEALKSSQGDKIWLEFFKLVSAIFALEENTPLPKQFLGFTKEILANKLTLFVHKHKILDRLHTIQATKFASNHPQLSEAAYWVIETMLDGKPLSGIHSFSKRQKQLADSTYQELEQSPDCKSGKKQVVLVSADSISKMKKAYPNFFGNINDFMTELQRILNGK